MRGAGTTICFLILAVIFGFISSGIASILAPLINVSKYNDIENSRGLWQLILFGILFISVFPLSIFINKYTQWTYDPYDWFFALLFGSVAAFIAVHYFLESFYFASSGSIMRETFANSLLIRQMVHFESWHNFLNWFNTVMSGEKRPVYDVQPER
jgi:hypothetical protein